MSKSSQVTMPRKRKKRMHIDGGSIPVIALEIFASVPAEYDATFVLFEIAISIFEDVEEEHEIFDRRRIDVGPVNIFMIRVCS